jgi:DNA polymerase-3 subunit alpha
VSERVAGGYYKSIFDFCSRVSGKSANRATIESLIRGGAFDSLHGVESRAALLAVLDKAISIGASVVKDKESGQGGLFGVRGPAESSGANESIDELPNVTPWTKNQTLEQEKEVLGIHVSGHPLDECGDALEAWCTDNILSLQENKGGRRVVVGGVLVGVRIVVIRTGKSAGQKMAILSLQDRVGKIECVIFSNAYQKYATLLQQDAIVLIDGKSDRSRGELQIIVDRVTTIQDAPLYLAKRIEFTFHRAESNGSTQGQMEFVSGLIKQAGAAKVSNGATPAEVVVHVVSGKHTTTIRSQKRVVIESKLVQQIGEVIGENNIRIISVNTA